MSTRRLAAAMLFGCGALAACAPTPSFDAAPPDVTVPIDVPSEPRDTLSFDATDATEGFDGHDGTPLDTPIDAIDASDTLDAFDAMDAPDIADAADGLDAPDVPDTGPRLTACADGGADVDTDATPLSLATDIQPLFDAHCSCHETGGQAPFLFAGVSYAQLVCQRTNVPCHTTSVLVAPGDPDHSALYLRVAGTGCFDQMPLGGPYLSDVEIARIRDWIASGANP